MMNRSTPLKLSIASFLAYVILTAVVVGAVGAWPTWRLAGRSGLHAMLAGGGIVLFVKIAFAYVIVRQAARGPGRAAFAFILLTLVRLLSNLLLAGGAWALFNVSRKLLLIWTGLFYFALIVAESIWLARAFQRDAFQVALGNIPRK